MARKLYFTILLLLFVSIMYAQYIPDVLGDNYLRRTIQMPDDYEGKVVCTLVKKSQLPGDQTGNPVYTWLQRLFFSKAIG